MSGTITKNDEFVNMAPKETVVGIRGFNGEYIVYRDVKSFNCLWGGALQFVTSDNMRHTVGPAIRWEVREHTGRN